MKMNKKGFTLVELLATMVILSLISLVAVPNVLKIMTNNKKEKVLNDGLSMIAQAKGKIASDYDLREQINETGYSYTLQSLDTMSDLTNDPDGMSYNRTSSFVKVYKKNNLITYCAYLESNNWLLNNNGNCVNEENLLLDNAKDYVKEK